MLIVFEGIDGSGKTTQAMLLYKWLSKRRKCVLTKEPTDGSIGRMIRQQIARPLSRDTYYNAFVQSLFVADRIIHVEKVILPNIKKGNAVITDRYALSTIAYGSAVGIDRRWLRKANEGFPKADMTLILDISEKTALGRKKHTDTFETHAFSRKVRRAYLEEAKGSKGMFVIDADRKPAEVHKEIINIVSHYIKRK